MSAAGSAPAAASTVQGSGHTRAARSAQPLVQPLARFGPERRTSAPLAQLSRQLNTACVGALHPQELAAILEAEGFTDALVLERYGHRDVFGCAEALFGLVPYRPPLVFWRPQDAPFTAWRDLLRGVLYLLPALWSPFALGGNGWGWASSLGLLVASLFGWGWMQSVAYLGYRGLVLSPAAASAALRRSGVLAALATGLLAMMAAWISGQNLAQVGLIGLAIAAYLAAATALLVLGEELALLLSALPALGWVLLRLIWPGHIPGEQQLALLLAAVGLPLLSAWRVTRRHLKSASGPAVSGSAGQPSRRRAQIKRAAPLDWRRAWPYAVYGWLCAAFLALVLLRPFTGPVDPVNNPVDAAALLGWSWSVAPLVLSMGVLELSLRAIHAALRRAAQEAGELRSIVRHAAWQMLRRCAAYAGALLLLYLLNGALAPLWGAARPPPLLILGHLELGSGLLLSGLLINFGLLGRVVLVWALAVAAQAALLVGGGASAQSYALSAAAALSLLLALSYRAVLDVRNLA
ncbi:hypothetical protein [Deinococcus sp.]|uniref:hypothetical protein n=1 Tax=Deinococcus sp. TaxID=47478 RepID=UPI0025D7EC06|nr:hypothetical protein [Deinococcus sp.]